MYLGIKVTNLHKYTERRIQIRLSNATYTKKYSIVLKHCID